MTISQFMGHFPVCKSNLMIQCILKMTTKCFNLNIVLFALLFFFQSFSEGGGGGGGVPRWQGVGHESQVRFV